MVYKRAFIKMTFGGTLAEAQEIWNCSIHIGSAPDTPIEFITTVLENGPGAVIDDLGEAVGTFFTNPLVKVPVGFHLGYIKLAAIDTNGQYAGPAIEKQLNYDGTASNSGYVPQNALVNTLVCDKWKDPGKYNRFYMPICTPVASGSYMFTANEIDLYSDATKQFINDLNTALGSVEPDYRTVVAIISNSGAGYENPVTEVRVGRVIDTQRRRRNKLKEQYVTKQL